MTMDEWVNTNILSVTIADHGQFAEFYKVGVDGVTRIEATIKSGMHANIPYVRVWKGDQIHSEHCQHNIDGVYFAPVGVEAVR